MMCHTPVGPSAAQNALHIGVSCPAQLSVTAPPVMCAAVHDATFGMARVGAYRIIGQ